jgi:hypothetical protein
MDTLLTGVEFVKGWKKELFIAKWTMHQLVRIKLLLASVTVISKAGALAELGVVGVLPCSTLEISGTTTP